MKYYNKTNTCNECETNFKIVKGHPHRITDEKVLQEVNNIYKGLI